MVNGILINIVNHIRINARKKRSRIFLKMFELTPQTRILDLGSEDGANIAAILKNTPIRPENVYIADINGEAVKNGHKRFGFNPVVISESEKLPFDVGFFDIVYCSSVIEHVTVPKSDIWNLKSGKLFKKKSLLRQKKFVDEIKRLGKKYFVQTPYKWFPIESHSWIPFMGYLPRRMQLPCIVFCNKFWIKKTVPDWYLLNIHMMKELFPDAIIEKEKAFGLTKSIMAIRSH